MTENGKGLLVAVVFVVGLLGAVVLLARCGMSRVCASVVVPACPAVTR